MTATARTRRGQKPGLWRALAAPMGPLHVARVKSVTAAADGRTARALRDILCTEVTHRVSRRRAATTSARLTTGTAAYMAAKAGIALSASVIPPADGNGTPGPVFFFFKQKTAYEITR